MFALLTVKNLRKNTNDWAWLSNFIAEGKESQTGRASVVLGLLRIGVSGFMYLITQSFC